MKYRLQISQDGKDGADYGNKDERDCSDFLNQEVCYSTLNIKKIIDDLIKKMENSPFSDNYKGKIDLLKSKENYKVLVIGVGRHGNHEIELRKEDDIKAKEIAHIDRVDEEGSWMNRLCIFDEKPESMTFYNKKLHKEKKVVPEFEEHCFYFDCKF